MNKRQKMILVSKIKKLDELIEVGLNLFIQKRMHFTGTKNELFSKDRVNLPKNENVDKEIIENDLQKDILYKEVEILCQS